MMEYIILFLEFIIGFAIGSLLSTIISHLYNQRQITISYLKPLKEELCSLSRKIDQFLSYKK